MPRWSALASCFSIAALLVACSSGSAATSPSNIDATTPDDAAAATADGSQTADSAPNGGDDAGDENLDARGGVLDAPSDSDAGNACEWGGSPGVCITVTACAALADHTSYSGECPGPATIQCCITTPSTADNPPSPAGWELMQQADVTSDMTTWAVSILNDPTTYPMFSTTTKTFGTLQVLARVEWHPPDFQNSVIHRGVTLYEPSD